MKKILIVVVSLALFGNGTTQSKKTNQSTAEKVVYGALNAALEEAEDFGTKKRDEMSKQVGVKVNEKIALELVENLGEKNATRMGKLLDWAIKQYKKSQGL